MLMQTSETYLSLGKMEIQLSLHIKIKAEINLSFAFLLYTKNKS